MTYQKSNKPKIWPYVIFTLFAVLLLGIYRFIAAGLVFDFDIHPIFRSDFADVIFQKQIFDQLVSLGLMVGRKVLPLLVLIYCAKSLYQQRVTSDFAQRLLKPVLLTFAVTAGVPLIIFSIVYLPQGEAGIFAVQLLFATLTSLASLVFIGLITPLFIVLAYKYSKYTPYLKVLPLVLIIGSIIALSVYSIKAKTHFASCGIIFPSIVQSADNFKAECLGTKAVRANDPNICESSFQHKDGCYDTMVVITGDYSICDRTQSNASSLQTCHTQYLRNTGQLK